MKKIIVAIAMLVIMTTATAYADEILGHIIPIEYKNTVTMVDPAYDGQDFTIYNVKIDEWANNIDYEIWYSTGGRYETGYIWTTDNSLEFDIGTKEGRYNFWRAISMVCELGGVPKKGLGF